MCKKDPVQPQLTKNSMLLCILLFYFILFNFTILYWFCQHAGLLRNRASTLHWRSPPWPTSLCTIGSSFIHPTRTDSNVFLSMAEQYSTVYMHHSFPIHSSAVGHPGRLHVPAITNSAAMTLMYERSCGLRGRGRGWEDLGEWH